MPDEIEPAGGMVPGRRGKKIVVFADGTGNSFSRQESNVWRLYQTLDKTVKPGAALQLARYIPGVGTSGNAVVRMIDGATGIGVPSNVRKLYRFLCWNWEPGDEIYLFGFSRGAFTVRTLAALVAMQGLMPRRVDGREISSAEMSRNAHAAWHAYRTMTAPLVLPGTSVLNPLNWKMNPLISLVRLVRDGVTTLKRRLLGQRTHAEVLASLPPERQAGAVRIRFMGLFDTVEAYGMPVEEMRDLWNRLVWPIKFRNRRCSWVVQDVRHALALDDERRSFHPIRFDVSPRPDGRPVPETQEVWFAGVHSDVGGGYPNDESAYEPLLWIAGEATRQGLVFDNEALSRYRKRLYPQALIHDSRKGLASLYRYAPRRVRGGDHNGGVPVVHHSVLEKMKSGADGYAPLGLPSEFRVFPSDGTGWVGLTPSGLQRDTGAVEAVRRMIWWRAQTNWLTIGLVGVLAAMPPVEGRLGRPDEPGLVVRGLSAVIGGLVPGWALTWVDSLLRLWWLTLPVVLALWAIYSFNQSLAYRIRDTGRRLWRKAG
jgi:uncharacterized protein (DUF2235 family)